MPSVSDTMNSSGRLYRKCIRFIVIKVKTIRSEYFEGLLNVLHDREADVVCLTRGGMRSETHDGRYSERKVEEVKTLRKMKYGKDAGVDGIAVVFFFFQERE